MREKLEKLLSEGVTHASKRAAETFDRAAFPFEKRIVIYGAGSLGRRILQGLRANGMDALAFVDRNPESWSRPVDGLPVLSAEDAVARYAADSVFVVAVWNSANSAGVQAVLHQLTRMGCSRVVPFVWLFWKFPRTFLPTFLWDLPARVMESAEDIRAAFSLFRGARSQDEFLRQLKLRLTGDFGLLRTPDGDPQYFPSELFRPREAECFVDCGAYDGDTLLGMAEWAGEGWQQAVAFEADPENFTKLERTVAADKRLTGRVRMIQRAVGAEKGLVRFASAGSTGSAVTASGGVEVQCSTIDGELADGRATYIKMDIEGAEMDALAGAKEVMARDRPTMAVCVYHLQDHLWQVPRRIQEAMPGSHFALRSYCINGFELVCYAVPEGSRRFNDGDAGESAATSSAISAG